MFHVYPVRDSPEGLSIFSAPLGMLLDCAGRCMVQGNHSKAYAPILTDRGRSRTTLPSTGLVKGMGDHYIEQCGPPLYVNSTDTTQLRACDYEANDMFNSVMFF